MTMLDTPVSIKTTNFIKIEKNLEYEFEIFAVLGSKTFMELDT